VVSLLLSLNVCVVHLVPMVVYCCSYSSCAFSLLVMNIVVASCWFSRGDVESSVLLLLHARTHLKKKKKKKKNLHLLQSCCLNEEGRYI
jgi:hypothetical protein